MVLHMAHAFKALESVFLDPLMEQDEIKLLYNNMYIVYMIIL